MNLTGISRPRSSSFLLCYLSQPISANWFNQSSMPRMKNLPYNAAGMQLCGRDAEKHACCDTRSAWARDSMRAAWVCDEKAQVMDGYPVDHLPVEFRPLPRRGMSLLVFRLPLAPGRESGSRGSCSRLRVCCSPQESTRSSGSSSLPLPSPSSPTPAPPLLVLVIPRCSSGVAHSFSAWLLLDA